MIKLERLELKKLVYEDIERLVELFKNDEIKKTYMIPNYDSDEKYIRLGEHFVNLSNQEEHFIVGVYLKDYLIGFINDVEIKLGTIELGYVIDPKYKNKGYCTEALNGSINYLFEKGFIEIVCGAFSNNIASIRVMEKVGLILLNKMDTITYNGINYDCVYYSIFKGMK